MNDSPCTDRYTDERSATGLPWRDASAARPSAVTRALLAEVATSLADTARARGMSEPPVPHLGADRADSPDPHVAQLRAAGASFDWLALARPDAPMWDEHVGVVHVGGSSYDVGVHVADRLPYAEDRIRQIAESLGCPATHSGPSREHQVVVGRLRLPEQHDEVVRLSLDLVQRLSRPAR